MNVLWIRNFSNTQQGTWYYRYSLGSTFEDTIKSVSISKDNTNISYGGVGNSSSLTRNQTAQQLAVRVYDKDASKYSLNPSATVNFKLIHSNYAGGEKLQRVWPHQPSLIYISFFRIWHRSHNNIIKFPILEKSLISIKGLGYKLAEDTQNS